MQSSTLIQISPEELTNLIVEKIALILQKQEPKAQTPTDETELLTVQETAAFLSLSVPTIYGLIHKGDLPNLKQGKRCYLLKKDLLAYLEQGRRKSNSEIEREASAAFKKFKK